jgi:hypothetical protein
MVMTKAKKTVPVPADVVPDAPKELQLKGREGVSNGHILAESTLHPLARHSWAAGSFASRIFGGTEFNVNDGMTVMGEVCAKVRDGDLSMQRDMLTAQSMTLDAVFTELARRAALNMATNLDATDRYMRMALKAQAQSRATMETIDRLVRGGEQVVRHIHVDNRGGQAMIAETINTGGHEMEKQSDNPMQSKVARLHLASRCGARTRSGKPCQSPGMPNGRCRMHGGGSPGAPKGNRNAWKHGARSAAAMEVAALIRALG